MESTLSDLFFMVDNSGYFSESLDKSEQEAVLLENATQFSELVEKLGHSISPEDIVADFKARV